MNGELAKTEPAPLATVPESPLAMLVRLSKDASCDVEKLKELVGLAERFEDRVAARAFATAKAAFQADCDSIPKTSTAKIVSKSGGMYSYSYAELDQIVRTIRKPMTDHGLTFSWDSKTEGAMIEVVCKLTHVDGHSETATFTGSTESSSPGMSKIQQVASALTFARRQALVQVLGLTTTDPDNDGAGSQQQSDQTIDAEQQNTIDALLIELDMQTPASRKRFYAAVGTGVAKTSDIPVHRYEWAVDNLKGKIKAGQ